MFSSCFKGSKEEDDTHVSSSDEEPQKPVEMSPEEEKRIQEAKIEQSRKVFAEYIQDLDSLFRNREELLDLATRAPKAPKDVHVGPTEEDNDAGIGDSIYGKSVSSYPKKPPNPKDTKDEDKKERLGDPICDCYGFQILGEGSATLAVADGCNWGPKPLEAARIAMNTFHKYMREQCSELTSVKETGNQLLKAFSASHMEILHAPLNRGINDIWETGTTTLCGGVLLRLSDESSEQAGAPYIFICASVGDCKAFLITPDGTVADVTTGNRPGSSVTNVNDPGGRLGPYVGKEGSADLRNLGIFMCPCKEDDVIILLSDGVYDNLDPQQLGVPTRELNLDADSWEDTDMDEAEKAKDEYRNGLISKCATQMTEGAEKRKKGKSKGGKGKVLSLEDLTNNLLLHSKTVTKYSRKWMEEHPTARMPDHRSKKKDPNMLGKMDHATCVCIRVGWTKLEDSSDEED